MAGTAHLWGDREEEKGTILSPMRLLQTAYDAVMANPRILAGGSTASLAVIDAEGGMECAKYITPSCNRSLKVHSNNIAAETVWEIRPSSF
jgi:hypothetical protein